MHPLVNLTKSTENEVARNRYHKHNCGHNYPYVNNNNTLTRTHPQISSMIQIPQNKTHPVHKSQPKPASLHSSIQWLPRPSPLSATSTNPPSFSQLPTGSGSVALRRSPSERFGRTAKWEYSPFAELVLPSSSATSTPTTFATLLINRCAQFHLSSCRFGSISL